MHIADAWALTRQSDLKNGGNQFIEVAGWTAIVAAGLAVANTYRNQQAILGQGVRNANDGLSTLQIIDDALPQHRHAADRALVEQREERDRLLDARRAG